MRRAIITSEYRNDDSIPTALGPVPTGAYLVIRFDDQGPGANNYDLGAGIAVHHRPSSLVDIFEDEADQVALYIGAKHKPDALRDFIAYASTSPDFRRPP